MREHRWEDNIKCVLKKHRAALNLILVAQDKGQKWVSVNRIMNLQIP
jgi:hypothetical protein